MANANTKTVLQRREKFLTAWREHAPDATFAETSLAEFEAQTNNLDLVIQQMKAAQSKLDGFMLDRDKAVHELNEKMLLIAHGIRGTPQYGEDCSLYRALGFVPKSERKTGLKRNNGNASTESADAA
jgi:prophage DNA circulation protein